VSEGACVAVREPWVWGALLTVCLPAWSGSSLQEQVEADWRLQDQARMRQIEQPGLVRFVEGDVQWPGARPLQSARVPLCDAPRLDGALDDACWGTAMAIEPAAPNLPRFLVAHDAERLHIAADMPSSTEVWYRGEPTAMDAGGAVDGVRDGRYAFHTGGDTDPWWQVDLGAAVALGRLVVYNRLDYAPGLHNADSLRVLLSDDEQVWREVYRNPGTFFGGLDATGPLHVDLQGQRARYVRLQVPGAVLFHLDEVEVYGPGDPDHNLALGRPAKQSSLSIWSRGGPSGGVLVQLGGTTVVLPPGQAPRAVAAGYSAEAGAVARKDGRTRVELALPLAEVGGAYPGAARLATADAVPLPLGASFEVRLADAPVLGYGAIRLPVTVRASQGRWQGPVDLSAELIVFTPWRMERVPGRAVTVDEPGTVEAAVTGRHEGPAVLYVTARQGDSVTQDARTFYIHPARETTDRARKLLAEFGRPVPAELRRLEHEIEVLERRERADGPDPAARAELYRRARWLARDVAFSNPALEMNALLLVKRFTQQPYPDVCLNHMPWTSRPGGDICVLSPVRPDGEIRPLIGGQLGPGHVHGVSLWFDGDRVAFGYARTPTDEPAEGWLNRLASYDLRRTVEPIHVFEIRTDGTGLRQLTSGPWSDLDPAYLPNGDIAFVSERCGYSLQCNEYDKDETSCNLYVMRPDGSDVRRMSVTKDGDYLPHVLDNGLLTYTRWEYQERNWANIQSIWVVNPDGTGADALYKQHFNDPWGIEEARSIPGSGKLLAIATGHHTLPVGPLVLVDQKMGINEPRGISIVTPGSNSPEGGMEGRPVPEGGVPGGGGLYATPWPLSEQACLASLTYSDLMTDEKGYGLYLIDVYGTRELIYRDPDISCFYPIPLRPRPRPPVLAPSWDQSAEAASCLVTDVTMGMDGIEPERVKYLRIAEGVAWPYDFALGGLRYEPDIKSVMINWNPVRILGTVPVEPDGSAHFEVPADTPVYFQALDERMMEIRRMRSFISFQPGERRSCAGCHETRGIAPPNSGVPMAAQRGPSPLIPPPWGDGAISFLRDVQPVFDRNCVSCHSGMKPAGGLDYGGGLTPAANTAWDAITRARLVARSNVGDDTRITQPLDFGSHKSRLIEVIESTHRDRVRLSEEDRIRLVTWIDANAPYHSGFINKRPEQPAYDLPIDEALRSTLVAAGQKRCAACHVPEQVARLDWIDLHEPADSRFLAAPLAAEAGGLGRCQPSVYADTTDPDYAALVALVRDAVARAWAAPRRDLATLDRPRDGQVAEAP